MGTNKENKTHDQAIKKNYIVIWVDSIMFHKIMIVILIKISEHNQTLIS